MKPRMQKLLLIGVVLALISLAVTLVLNAFEDNLVFFHTPTEIKERNVPFEKTVRIGGLVEKGSIARIENTTEVEFNVTDNNSTIRVSYSGILPDLFREGQGVVAEGKLMTDGKFIASRVFARHDETYMPPEAAEALKRAHDAGVGAQNPSNNSSETKGYK